MIAGGQAGAGAATMPTPPVAATVVAAAAAADAPADDDAASSILLLPTEVEHQIFASLPTSDLAACMATCRAWRASGAAPGLWRAACTRRWQHGGPPGGSLSPAEEEQGGWHGVYSRRCQADAQAMELLWELQWPDRRQAAMRQLAQLGFPAIRDALQALVTAAEALRQPSAGLQADSEAAGAAPAAGAAGYLVEERPNAAEWPEMVAAAAAAPCGAAYWARHVQRELCVQHCAAELRRRQLLAAAAVAEYARRNPAAAAAAAAEVGGASAAAGIEELEQQRQAYAREAGSEQLSLSELSLQQLRDIRWRTLEEGALALAQVHRPTAEFNWVRQALDGLGAELRRRIDAAGATTRLDKLRLLNHLLFGPGPPPRHRQFAAIPPPDGYGLEITGNRERYYEPSNSLLDSVLINREGIPISMAVLHAAVGVRAGLPIELLNVPMHVVTAMEEETNEAPSVAGGGGGGSAAPTKRYYIDVFDGGRIMDRAEFGDFLQGLGLPASTGLDAQGMTPQQCWVRMCRNLLHIYREQQEHTLIKAVAPLMACAAGEGTAESMRAEIEVVNACLALEQYEQAAELLRKVGMDMWGLWMLPVVQVPAWCSVEQCEQAAELLRKITDSPYQVQLVGGAGPLQASALQTMLADIQQAAESHQQAQMRVRRRQGPDAERVLFRAGQVMRHKRYHYRGVIVGWDTECRASEEWMQQMGVDRLPGGRAQPFYHVLPDPEDRPGQAATYVAQENIALEPLPALHRSKPGFALHPEAGRYFAALAKDGVLRGAAAGVGAPHQPAADDDRRRCRSQVGCRCMWPTWQPLFDANWRLADSYQAAYQQHCKATEQKPLKGSESMAAMLSSMPSRYRLLQVQDLPSKLALLQQGQLALADREPSELLPVLQTAPHLLGVSASVLQANEHWFTSPPLSLSRSEFLARVRAAPQVFFQNFKEGRMQRKLAFLTEVGGMPLERAVSASQLTYLKSGTTALAGRYFLLTEHNVPVPRHEDGGVALSYAGIGLPTLLRRMRRHDSQGRLLADDDAALAYIQQWLAAWPESESGQRRCTPTMEVALDKLRGVREKLPPEQRCSDMLNLLEALEGLQSAEAELQAAKEEGVPATDARVFKILVGLLRSLALCGSSAHALFGSSKLSNLLKNDMLQPVMAPFTDGQGRTQHAVQVPQEGLAALRPDSAIKMLLAAVEVGRCAASAGPQQAVKVFDMVFTSVWLDTPAPMPENAQATELQLQLEAQRWVPAWPTLRMSLVFSSRAAPVPPLAHILLRDCQQLLSECDHAASQMSPSCAALRAFDILIASNTWAGSDRARVERVTAFLDASIARAVEAGCWLEAVELIHRKLQFFALPPLRPGSGRNRRDRQQARQEAHALLDQARRCLKASKAWLPARFQQESEAHQQRWESTVASLEGGGGGAASAPKPKADMPSCSGCGTPRALHLRKCAQCRVAAYCSTACQVKHWKAGHKEECAQMAAEHAAEAASAD
ncbi:F-box only 21-like [Chlorella sorokiniana]|uniref:F-box only 21-like n=1 Tax=Chlorella sorokiniana TaxID=3076 RepID=A0A2P6TNQ3_CHLSO|nr:F-box only 21-like [Chlorella sorokiniana]|eukprot:PRW50954.1 F-box only 21-like [Chlorella sorokiniana]